MKAPCETCAWPSSFLVKVEGRIERRCGACLAAVRAKGRKVSHLEGLPR